MILKRSSEGIVNMKAKNNQYKKVEANLSQMNFLKAKQF